MPGLGWMFTGDWLPALWFATAGSELLAADMRIQALDAIMAAATASLFDANFPEWQIQFVVKHDHIFQINFVKTFQF